MFDITSAPPSNKTNTSSSATPPSTVPIKLTRNNLWVNMNTRAANKYSPAKVDKGQPNAVLEKIRQNREGQIQEMMLEDGALGYSFNRGVTRDDNLSLINTPAFVLSSGAAEKLKNELTNNLDLAWHPALSPKTPIYIFTHNSEVGKYREELKEVLEQHSNLKVIGWESGQLTGFGAARHAASTFASTLKLRDDRYVVYDQDVLSSPSTRISSPFMQQKVKDLHAKGHDIVGMGVGYPLRVSKDVRFDVSKPSVEDKNSPTQQAVSIISSDNPYSPIMVTGGEDMLVGFERQLFGKSEPPVNEALVDINIFKKELSGSPDRVQPYWNEHRVTTIKKLYNAEKNTLVDFEGSTMTIDALMFDFVKRGWLSSHPSIESMSTASSIIERIILRHAKEADTAPRITVTANRRDFSSEADGHKSVTLKTVSKSGVVQDNNRGADSKKIPKERKALWEKPSFSKK